MPQWKLTPADDESGIALPEALRRDLGLAPGDAVTVRPTAEGLLLLAADDDALALTAARRAMDRYADALHLLAQ